MTATTRSAEDGMPDPGNETSQSHAPATDATDGLLVGMASPDRCTECGAEMAVDQRYCVECGNRRGPARFALARKSAPKSTAVVPHRQTDQSRMVTLMVAAGIIIALLGVGVGVLIGHDGKAKPVPVKVSVSGVSSGASKAASGGSSSTPSGGTSTGTSTGKTKNFFGG